MSKWLTTGECARRTGYSIPWVRQQIKLGRLPARAHQGSERCSYRVLERDLNRFMERFLVPAED